MIFRLSETILYLLLRVFLARGIKGRLAVDESNMESTHQNPHPCSIWSFNPNKLGFSKLQIEQGWGFWCVATMTFHHLLPACTGKHQPHDLCTGSTMLCITPLHHYTTCQNTNCTKIDCSEYLTCSRKGQALQYPADAGQVWNAGFMCHTWGLARIPADLHVGLPLEVFHVVHVVGQQGGVLDPKCGTSILHFRVDWHLLVQVSSL